MLIYHTELAVEPHDLTAFVAPLDEAAHFCPEESGAFLGLESKPPVMGVHRSLTGKPDLSRWDEAGELVELVGSAG